MTVNLSALAGAGQQFFDNNGVILSGGKLYSYTAGTSTPQATYTSISGSTAHTNPIVLDSAGRVSTGEIWLTAGSNYKFVLYTSANVLITTWDNITGINGTGIASNASNVTYDPAGSGAVSTTVQAKLRQYVSVMDFGAVGNGTTDDTAAFTAAGSYASVVEVNIPKGVYLLNSNPAPTGNVTWVVNNGASFTGSGTLTYIGNRIVSRGAFKSIESDSSFYNGIFGYLESNAAETGYGIIGLHGSTQSVGGNGLNSSVNIAVAAFSTNNLVGNLGGAWGIYSTVLRKAASGSAHGMEIDVANMGNTVPLYPATPFFSGLTSGIWCCTGGESSEPTAGGSPGVASVGLAFIQNDLQTVKTAKFEKGILFHNLAINGADGTGGSNVGTAIAFATGHAMQWYNNSNQTTAEILNTGATAASTNMRLDFANDVINFQNRTSGITQFSIENTTGLINFANGTITGTAGAQFGFFQIKVNNSTFKVPIYAL
jgi:hypothetical protein